MQNANCDRKLIFCCITICSTCAICQGNYLKINGSCHSNIDSTVYIINIIGKAGFSVNFKGTITFNNIRIFYISTCNQCHSLSSSNCCRSTWKSNCIRSTIVAAGLYNWILCTARQCACNWRCNLNRKSYNYDTIRC